MWTRFKYSYDGSMNSVLLALLVQPMTDSTLQNVQHFPKNKRQIKAGQ